MSSFWAPMPSPISATAIPGPARQPFRWVMLAGLWCIYACFGLVLFAMGPLVSAMIETLNLDLAQMGAILGAWPLVFIATALPAGAILDRFGVQRSLLAGAVVIVLSTILRAFAVDFWSMFLAVAVFGVGGPLISVGAPKLISAWFAPDEQGTAMGLYMTGPAIGAITSLGLTNSVVMPFFDHDWRATLLCYAAVVAVVAVAWAIAISHPASRTPELAGGSPAKHSGWRGYAQLFRPRAVKLLLLLGMGTFAFGHGTNNWLPEILRSGGMSETQAGWWAAIPGMIGLFFALLVPRYTPAERRIPILLVLYALAALACVTIATSSGGTLGAGLLLLGIARGGTWPLTVLLLMNSPGVNSANMGAAGGMYFSAAEIGGVLGPMAIGYLAQRSGSFALPLYALAGLCGVLIALSLLVRAASR